MRSDMKISFGEPFLTSRAHHILCTVYNNLLPLLNLSIITKVQFTQHLV